jgi:hypothetical protein
MMSRGVVDAEMGRGQSVSFVEWSEPSDQQEVPEVDR